MFAAIVTTAVCAAMWFSVLYFTLPRFQRDPNATVCGRYWIPNE